jgi:hypothetical protein
MSWYYSKEDQRLGPVSEEELLRLAGEGSITPKTKVWKDGMADWQLWGSGATAMFPDNVLCQACSRPFPKDDLVTVQGVMICGACKPAQLQRIREGLMPLDGGGLAPTFGSGNRMIVALNTPLPNRCVCCNGPASASVRRTFRWDPPWVYLLILLTPAVLIVVSLMARRSVRMDIPLCDEHLRLRGQRLWTCWAVGICSIIAIFPAATLSNNNHGDLGGFLFLLSFASLLGAIIVGHRAASILGVHKIGKETVTFGRVSPEFIGSLPHWPGGPAL